MHKCAHVALVLACLCISSGARAHAPVPRALALTADGGGSALSLPGFGLLFRARADQPYSYVCDALLALRPSDTAPSMAFLDDGSLLLGSPDGVRILGADGCPTAAVDQLATADLIALARHSDQAIYALVGGEKAGLWRSADAGRSWQQRATLSPTERPNALLVSARDPQRVYWSVATNSGGQIVATENGGETLTTHTQTERLTLLSADGPAPYPFWAVQRDPASLGNNGYIVVRAQSLAGPWLDASYVQFFGGLAIDSDGTIWLGDETGGLYRSVDAGESFRMVAQEANVACLTLADHQPWLCTPDVPYNAAVYRFGRDQILAPQLVPADVDHLVTCPQPDVASVCARAWTEWERDVRTRPVTPEDAGISAADASVSAADASVDAADEATEKPHTRPTRVGCSIGSADTGSLWPLLALLAAVSRRARARVRHTRTPSRRTL